jgi:hypothetical protein
MDIRSRHCTAAGAHCVVSSSPRVVKFLIACPALLLRVTIPFSCCSSCLELTSSTPWTMQCLSYHESRLTIILILFLSFLLSPNARAQLQVGVQQFLYPPTIPLAVRSPYLNCWLQYNQSFTASFGHTLPTTFNHSQVLLSPYFTSHEILNFFCQTLGWTFLVRVDNLTYSFLGDVDPNLINGTVNSTNIMVGPSSTILGGQAGPMQVNLTFLNPIEVRFHSFVSFNVYTRIILSPKIGSSNPSHSRICLSPQSH